MHPGFPAYRERLGEFIRRAPALSSADSEAMFQALALELFRLQFETVAPYRRLCESRGIVPGAAAWETIPSVPTSAFKEFELTSLPPRDRTCVFVSSGTTGPARSRHFHGVESLATYEQSLWPPFRGHLLAGADSVGSLIVLAPPSAQAPHSSLVHMFDTVRRQLGAPASVFVGRSGREGAWELDLNAAGRALGEAGAGGLPALVLGTAFSFVQLLEAVAGGHVPIASFGPRASLALPAGSRAMETGGYKGRTRELPKAELRRRVCQGLGIAPTRLVSEYGMSELSSQAYDHVAGQPEHSGGRVFRFPPWARAVVISAETGLPAADGETGLIRVFDLANVHSVMAIQTEDLGRRRGDGFEWVGRALQADARGCSLLAS